MPRKSLDPAEEERPQLKDAVKPSLEAMIIANIPTIVCGVNRKANLGQNSFESIDVYSCVTLPLLGASIEDLEHLCNLVTEMSELGFSMVSEETGKRYNLIKELQKKGNEDDGPT